MSFSESIPLTSVTAHRYSELDHLVDAPRGGFCSTLSNYAGKTWTAAKNAPGVVAGVAAAVVGVPLIAKSAELIKKSYANGPAGWTAWYEMFPSFDATPYCTAHLGEAAFNRLGGFDGILQGTKYLAVPVGYALGKCMKGRVGNVVEKSAVVLGAALDIGGNYGSMLAIQSGVRSPSMDGESFVQSYEGTEESTGAIVCGAKLSPPAITLFSSIVAKTAGNILLGLALGMHFGRKA